MRKDLILEVAYIKFSEKGYNTPLSEIAKASGIKKQTIYNYFDNKDELFYEMISMEVNCYFNKIGNEYDALKDLEASLKLKKMFFYILDYYKDLRKLRFWRWLLLIESQDLFKRTHEIIKERDIKFSVKLNNDVSEMLNNDEKRREMIMPIIQTYMVIIHGTLDAMLLYSEDLNIEMLFENVWNTFWNGIEKTINI